jgi:hypothetical protein
MAVSTANLGDGIALVTTASTDISADVMDRWAAINARRVDTRADLFPNLVGDGTVVVCATGSLHRCGHSRSCFDLGRARRTWPRRSVTSDHVSPWYVNQLGLA